MIFELPFCYTARIIKPRARDASNVNIRDRLPVDVPEFQAVESTVAARLMSIWPEGTIEYRRVGERLVRPLPRNGSSNKPFETADNESDAQAILDAWSRDPNRGNPGFMPDHWHLDNWCAMDIDDVRAARWIEDTRDSKATGLRNLFENNAAVIDGVLWVPSFGPAFQTSFELHDNYRNEQSRRVVMDCIAEIGWATNEAALRLVLPACHGVAAEKHFQELINIYGGHPYRRNASIDVTGELADMQDVMAFRLAAAGLVHDLGAEVHKLDHDGLLLYADVRDAIADTDPDLARLRNTAGSLFAKARDARIIRSNRRDRFTTFLEAIDSPHPADAVRPGA